MIASVSTRTRARASARLALVAGLAAGFGAAVGGCGPQKPFCADSGNGVCPTFEDAGAPVIDASEAPAAEMGSIYVGGDAATD